MTKLLTAVSAMQFVEKGNIGLDDDSEKVTPQLSEDRGSEWLWR